MLNHDVLVCEMAETGGGRWCAGVRRPSGQAGYLSADDGKPKTERKTTKSR